MASVAKTEVERPARAGKFGNRQAELVEAALQTLTELGYARTSVREIAQRSRFSHGVIHYYFSDKVELISSCVRDYKAKCVRRYDQIVLDARSYDELVDRFVSGLVETLRGEAVMHRLWYDLRLQALYDVAFRADVREIERSLEEMIWRVMSRAIALKGSDPRLSPRIAYAAVDGLFHHALLGFLNGDDEALPKLERQTREFLDLST